jgi:shikimate dehydrogenase
MAKKIYGIVGHPVAHSLSPAMQGAAFTALDIAAEYRLFDVEPARLEDFLGGLSRNGISGLNVTIPHKIKAREYAASHGSLDQNAARLGAINTIKVENGLLSGHNTDGAGFYRSLVKDLGFEPEGKNILVVGAGGAGSAIVMYLGNGPAKIFLMDIDPKRCDALKSHYKKYYDEKRLIPVKADDLKEVSADLSLLVNATPLGMNDADSLPVDAGILRAGLYVYDLVYNRPMTALVKEARRRKAHAVTGLGMLLYQGAIAFEIWTGKKAPVAAMKKALRAEFVNS